MRAKGKKPASSSRGSSSARSSSSRQPSSIEVRVDALAEILRRHELNELEVEEGGVRIYVRGRRWGEIVHAPSLAHSHAGAPVAHPVHTPVGPSSAPSSSGPSTDTGDGNVAVRDLAVRRHVLSQSPNPDASPFVDVGTRIKKGQVLCIVEAMKLMNEIEAEVAGIDRRVLVENGQAVEYGQPLFKIKRDGARPGDVQEDPHRQSRRDRAARDPRVPRARHRDGRRALDGRRRTRCTSSSPTRACASARRRRRRATSTSRRSSRAAEITGADAIHPGYGFLSENAEFAEICRALRAHASSARRRRCMRLMGDKIRAREAMVEAGVPILPGTGLLETDEQALDGRERIGFPSSSRRRPAAAGAA